MIQLVYIFLILLFGNVIYKTKQTKKVNNIDTVENNNEDDEQLELKYKLINRDKNTVDNPLAPPERRVEEQQYPRVQLYEKTRGTPDTYQLVGILYNDNNDKKYQLFGRRVYPGSYEWEYYIRGADLGGLDFKIPIDPSGNDVEIYNGSKLRIPIDNNVYNVIIYELDQPRYNPYTI